MANDHFFDFPCICWYEPFAVSLSVPYLYLIGLTFGNFLRRRATFNELLKSQETGLTINRYVRLMALASVEMIIVFPMSIAILVYNASTGLNPWISWENTHYDFGRISYISNFLFSLSPQSTITLFELTRWCMPLAGFLFFIFFGLASEARKQYKHTFHAFQQAVGMRPATLKYSDRKDTPYVFILPLAEFY
jgi:pheromone a factor receptor